LLLSKQTLQCYILSSLFFKDSLANPDWWKQQKSVSTEMTNENIVEILSTFQEEMKMGLLNSIFIHLEVFIRSTVFSIPISSSQQPNEKTNQIKEYLISQTAINPDFKNLISILSHIRNSFHFGGLHTNRPDQISYKGFDLKLEKGVPVPIGDWSDLKFLISELIEFYLAVSNSDLIKDIPFIEHPHSTTFGSYFLKINLFPIFDSH
jgi:hypothetical protein